MKTAPVLTPGDLFNARERATILAALQAWQWCISGAMQTSVPQAFELLKMATTPAMSVDEIQTLIERKINV